jgi:hypothetical protein
MSELSTTPSLDDDELTGVLHNMQDRREDVAADGSWEIAGRWRSFKADFVKARRGGVDVAVKFGDDWTADDAHYIASEVERVRRLFRSLPGGEVRVPRSLGWSASPAAVALRYVEGIGLFHALADPTDPLWDDGGTTAQALVRRCGQAIGAYHTAQPAVEDRAIAKLAFDDLLSAARRAGIRRRTIEAIEPRLERARGYRFSPNDFIVTPGGSLVMLDPPHVRKYDYLQRDVSAFTFELHRALIGERPLRHDDRNAELLVSLRRAFLDGYAETGPSPLDTELDGWMIAVFEISRVTGLGYARLRRRRLRATRGPLTWAVHERRRLGATPPGAS